MADYAEKSVEALVQEAQAAGQGDHLSFKELVERHRGKVLTNCRYLTRSEDDSEDLAQEVFVKAFFALKRLKSAATFSSWLKKIKVNHCLNFIRKRKDKVFVDVDSEPLQAMDELHVAASSDTDVSRRLRHQRIRQILASMSDSLRIPLILCDMDGLSYQEAADELSIGLSALKMRLKRGREYFREKYSEEFGPGLNDEKERDST